MPITWYDKLKENILTDMLVLVIPELNNNFVIFKETTYILMHFLILKTS